MKELDQKLLEFFNRTLSNPLFDFFFPFWTDFQKSVIFYIIIITFLILLALKKKWHTLLILVACTAGMYLSGFISSKLLKPIFERARPTNIFLRTTEHGSYSFPSSHAVNVFFMFTFLSLFFPKYRIHLLIVALLTSFSRIYCGVHFPGDILGGAVVGSLLGFGFYKLVSKMMEKKIKVLSTALLLLFCLPGFAVEDPTQGKPFFPWVWNEQLKPTIIKGFDKTGLIIAGATAVSVLAVHQYDGKIFDYNESGANFLMSEETASKIGDLGNGALGLVLAGSQYFFDQKNGIRTLRALLLTTIAHVSLAVLIQRDRPRNRSDYLPFASSFPSGHTASAFALAGSFAYSYGWKAGVPGYLLASAIGFSRLKENRHWASDVVGGAFLGTFWARASFNTEPVDENAFVIVPIPIYDGAMVSAMKYF